MTTQLIEPIQTLDERFLSKVSASEALDIVIRTIEMQIGVLFTSESARWLRCFIDEAKKHPVSTYKGMKSQVTPLGDLAASDVARGLSQWFSSVMYSDELHLLTSTYALETSIQVLDLLHGQYSYLDGDSRFRIAPILRYAKPYEHEREGRRFEDPQTKKSLTQFINRSTLRFVVPEGCEVQTLEGECVAAQGSTIRGSILRCHRSSSWYDHSWYRTKLSPESPATRGFQFNVEVGKRGSSGFKAKMFLPIEWATGVLHGDHCGWSDDVDYEFEPNPDWGVRDQVFSYKKRLETLRERAEPTSWSSDIKIFE